MIILKTTDFKGVYAIAQQNSDIPVLQSYIDRYEKTYIRELLGGTLGDLFIADLVAGVPQTQRFIDIYNEIFVDYEDNCGCDWGWSDCDFYGYSFWCDDYINGQRHSRGIKDLLLAKVWSEYHQGEFLISTQSGLASARTENADLANGLVTMRLCEMKINETLPSWETIRWYCKYKYPEIYPEYRGNRKKIEYSSLL